jgi:hypothetical protein
MDPRPHCAISRLKGSDLVISLQCQRDLVEPLQETIPPSWINLKCVLLSRRGDNCLRLQIYADSSRALSCFDFRSE